MCSVRVRAIEKNDIPEIERLNELQDFKLNNISNCIIDNIAIDDDRTIAYGIVKHFAEAVILVNPESTRLSRAKALRELLKVAVFGTKKAGLTQLHCFVSDEKVAQLLEKKFNFIRSKDICLVKNI